MVLDYSSIYHYHSLDQLGILPEDAITGVIKGLALVAHVELAKMFANFASDLKNLLIEGDGDGADCHGLRDRARPVHVVLVVGNGERRPQSTTHIRRRFFTKDSNVTVVRVVIG